MKQQLINVSTKQGDKGQTGLANGQRLDKDSPFFAAIGDLDELNSWLGLIITKFDHQFADYQQVLYRIQDSLFYLGAELALSSKTKLQSKTVKWLETQSFVLQQQMAAGWHRQFLLPGGTELGGWLDIARTVCRRAERSIVALGKQTKVRPVVLSYLNRLSDYLYVLRCYVNHQLCYQEKKFQIED